MRWTPEKLSVTDARASLYGGDARFGYEMAPLGASGVRPTARFNAEYQGISLERLSDLEMITADWVHWYNTNRLMQSPRPDPTCRSRDQLLR